jgi:hypothetical protein
MAAGVPKDVEPRTGVFLSNVTCRSFRGYDWTVLAFAINCRIPAVATPLATLTNAR